MQRVEGAADSLAQLGANLFILFRCSAALYNFIYAEFQPLWG